MKFIRPATESYLASASRSLLSSRGITESLKRVDPEDSIRIITFEDHTKSLKKPVARCLQQMIEKLRKNGITVDKILFELGSDIPVNGVEDYFQKGFKDLYKILAEKDLVDHIFKLCNDRYKTNIDLFQYSYKDLQKCLKHMTYKDCKDSVQSMFPGRDEVDIENKAFEISRLNGEETGVTTLSKAAIKIVGAENCLHIDLPYNGPDSMINREGMDKRDAHMSMAILENPNSLGFFGLAHYSGMRSAFELIQSMENNPSISHLQRVLIRNNRLVSNIVCLYPYRGDLVSGDLANKEISNFRNHQPNKKTPLDLKPIDVNGLSDDQLTNKIVDEVIEHKERFSAQALRT